MKIHGAPLIIKIRLMQVKSQLTKKHAQNLLSSANSNSTREKILGPDMLLDCYYVHSTSFKVTTTMHQHSLAQDGTGLGYVLRGDILAVEVE